MVQHLVAFHSSISPNTLTELGVIDDTVLTQPSPTRIRVPADLTTIDWAYAGGVNLWYGEIVAPSVEVRRMSLRIIPQNRGSITPYVSNAIYFSPPAEVSLVATEDLSVIALQAGAAAEDIVALVQFKAPGPKPAVPAGDVRLLRATGGVTLTPYKWTLVSPVFDKALEPGEYAVVGFIAISDNMIASRLIFPGAVYRPGVLGFSGGEGGALIYDGDFREVIQGYEFGRFTHINPPMIECLSAVADTWQVFYFYVVKTA